jgi:UDP-2,4-diacetamido-2,4,6-trideoxy-beta-L-altropyranose hydrolase
MRVAFRADSSALIGMGHLMRCITLADELAPRCSSIQFACRAQRGHASDQVQQSGHILHLLTDSDGTSEPAGTHRQSPWLSCNWQLDAQQTAEAVLQDAPLDWLVVDHYGIDENWEQAVLAAQLRQWRTPLRILAIDDLADRRHACSMLLDQNLQHPGRYDGLLAKHCEILLGPRHALVRPGFERLRSKGIPETRTDVLVYFGTSQGDDLPCRALQAFDEVAPAGWTATIVVTNDMGKSLQDLATRLGTQRCQLIRVPVNMLALMRTSHVAIGAAGTTAWERCTIGLPSVIVSVADNQVAGAQALHEAGAAFYLGPAESASTARFAKALGEILHHERHAAMRAAALSICDGRGAKRVAAAMFTAGLSFRAATMADAALLHAWRNNIQVRSASSDTREITPAEHSSWMEGVLGDPNRHLLIAQAFGHNCACLRFDVSDTVATISIYLAPNWLQSGIGGAVIERGSRWLFKARKDVRTIHANIKPSNQASRKAFERAGYSPHDRLFFRDRGAETNAN